MLFLRIYLDVIWHARLARVNDRYRTDTRDKTIMSLIKTAIAVFTAALVADMERCSGTDDVRAAFQLFFLLAVQIVKVGKCALGYRVVHSRL